MRRLLVLLLAAAAAAFAQAGMQIPGLEPVNKVPVPAPNAAGGRGGRGAVTADKTAPARGAVPAAPTPRDLKYPPPRTVQPPKVTAATLPNGLRLYLAENHELPIIGGVVMVRAGDAFDPPDRIGLASVAGYLLRNGGTAVKTGDQLDDTLLRLGMTMDSTATESAAIVTFTALKQNSEPSLALLREVLTQPEFRQDRVDQAKSRLRLNIAHRNDDLGVAARREIAGLIFGKDSPYGWQAEYDGLERITRAELKKFHQRYFFPANVMLGLWGDFDAGQMKATVEKLFASWPASTEAAPEFPKAKPSAAPGFYLGERKDAQVSYIAVAHPGGLVSQKDFPALELMGLMFNQLQARITQRARSQLGTSNVRLLGVTVDDVKAVWGAGFDHPGVFRIQGTSRGAATVEAVKAIHDDIERMRTVEVDEVELRMAKERALAAQAASFDTQAEAFRQWMTEEYYGYPHDFPQSYQAGILAVTRADVLRVAKEYLDPSKLTTVVIGNPQVFSTPLEKLNPQINRIDLTIPEAKPLVTESTDASIADGKRLLARAQAAVGGVEKLAAVKDYALVSDYQLDPAVPNMGGAKVPQTDRWIFPTTFRQDLVLPAGRISAYSDGKAGWISTPQGWGALAGAQLKQQQGDLFRSYFRLLLSDRIEARTVNAVDQNIVEITDTTGQLARLEFDPATGLPKRTTYDTPQQSGAPLFTEEVYDDFREVAGIKVPFKTVITQGGRKFADVAVTDCKINAGLKLVDLARRPQ